MKTTLSIGFGIASALCLASFGADQSAVQAGPNSIMKMSSAQTGQQDLRPSFNLQISLTEPLAAPGCPIPPPAPPVPAPGSGFCGTGMLIPFGPATDTLVLGHGCANAPRPCDLRTITLRDGSELISDEHVLSETFDPITGFVLTVKDVVAGGTGRFEGAQGSYSGTITAPPSLAVSHAEFSGSILLDPDGN
jgi:hypothetical protein